MHIYIFRNKNVFHWTITSLSFFTILVCGELQLYIFKVYHVHLYMVNNKINLGVRPKVRIRVKTLKRYCCATLIIT